MEEQTGKIRQDRVMTASVRSYPKPEYLFPGSGRKLLDEVGMTFYELEEETGTTEFKKRLDNAALMAIHDHNEAGIDLITDGEERRGHYVLYVLRKLDGVDFEHLRKKSIREGMYFRDLPIVVGKIAYTRPILVGDYEFIRKHAKGIAKIGLPGPSTVVDSVADEHYKGDRGQLAMDYAQAIRHEVKNLIEAGCRVIQFDDPVLLRDPEQAQRWGLKALQACFQDLESQATFIVHICRGYPDKELERKGVSYKANAGYYESVLSWLGESTIDIVSIEGAQSNLDLSVLPAIGKKTVMLGVVDVGSNEVESVESLVEKGREALRYLPREQLILASDCGMVQLSRATARRKLANIATAASMLNELDASLQPTYTSGSGAGNRN